MTTHFKLREEWTSAFDICPPEVKETYARLQISVGDRVATRVLDDASRSVRNHILVSLYPLAEWLASSWWRLRWEPRASNPSAQKELNYRMSHELLAAGGGFVWPNLVFESDGVQMDIRVSASATDSIPIQYLESFQASISGQEFESEIDAFMDRVLSRLRTLEIGDSELQSLWSEVQEERRDAALSQFRRLEAELGFDPDEGPRDAIEKIINLSGTIGESSADEIATSLALDNDPKESLRHIEEAAKTEGVRGRIEFNQESKPDAVPQDATSPGLGWPSAQAFRRKLGVSHGPIDSKFLANLLGISDKELLEGERSTSPIGLAVRQQNRLDVSLHFRKKSPVARRFEAARFLADAQHAPITDLWLPISDTKTARQKQQRAFAVEFLCPFEDLMATLAGDFSSEAMEDAAAYFDLSPLAIESHLANHGVIEFSRERY